MNSFLHGKSSFALSSLRLPPGLGSSRPAAPGAPAGANPGSAASRGAAEPSVEVIKEGDKIVRLVMVCSCGERVEVECLYPVGN